MPTVTFKNKLNIIEHITIINASVKASYWTLKIFFNSIISFKFSLQKLTAVTAWTITCPTAVVNGYVSVNYATIAAANESLVTFAHAADTIGDFVEMKCNGTTWDIYGVGNLAGAITVTAP